MSTTLIDNFSYRSRRFLDARQGVATLAELKAVAAADIPEGFRAYCAETALWYEYSSANPADPSTGKWRATGGSAKTTSFDDTALETGAANVQDAIDNIFAGYDHTLTTTYTVNTTAGTAVGRDNGTFGILPGQIKEGDTIEVLCTASSAEQISNYGFLCFKYEGNGGVVKQSVVYVGTPMTAVAHKNVEEIFVEFPANVVAGSGTLTATLTKEDKKEPMLPGMIEKQLEGYPILQSGDGLLSFCNTFGFKEYMKRFVTVPSIVVGGDNSLGRYERNLWNYVHYLPKNIVKAADPFLLGQSLPRIDANDTAVEAGGTLKFDRFIYESDGSIFQTLKDNVGKYIRAEVYVYSAHGDFPTVGGGATIYGSGQKPKLNCTKVEDTSSEHVKKLVFGPVEIQLPAELGYILFYIPATTPTVTYAPGTFGVTGWKIGIFDTLAEAQSKGIMGDWEMKDLVMPVTSDQVFSNDFYSKVVDFSHKGPYGTDFNMVADAHALLALFRNRYANRYTDKYNRLTVSFNGDSIIGSQLEDITHCDGYDSGDFPPNMSKKIVARQFFDRYRLAGEDVIFRNLIHSDWTRQGFDISNGKGDKTQTFNEIEVYGCAEGDYAQIQVTGKKYVKFVWSEYKGKPYRFDIMRSTDGGTTFTKAESVTVTAARQLMTAYTIMELDPTKTYLFKVVPTSGYADVCFWGIEAWTAPRLDVVVEAFSGSTAESNLSGKMDGYCSAMHRPALIIMDILAINDYSVSQDADRWMDAVTGLYNYIDGHKVPVLSFVPHYTNTFVKMGADLLKSRGNFAIDIPGKHANSGTSATSPIANSTDGLHLSNYGNSYYFEELTRIFDPLLLVE